ncbi:ATP-binding protein [Elizabethkingia ursingii]|uniref:EcoRII N-terminal effector-binding domain-containing protein n=1 Tax=Elizabethkingia ursingii TaxID=1756150 RepID=UPI002012EF8E|nr:EcoRII N-terminal effector-binding domain-containing protein [Elizabethkingia ursingii]MCL1666621.1 ATP-binding protein [Elizabethkingia ursingii]
MSETLYIAINTVKTSKFSFCKFASPNDTGATGAHQGGLYIPKKSYKLLFDEPGVKGKNKERFAEITWSDGTTSQCCLKYYGSGTRNEYRITRLGVHFKVDELVIICKISDDKYSGFKILDDVEKEIFLKEFGIEKQHTNALIPYEPNISEVQQRKPDKTEAEHQIELFSQEGIEVMTASFKPKAHILTLLGEELIKDPVMAIYELIKNSYDADAKKVEVHFNDILNPELANIIIKDSGTGMKEEVLRNVWLEPGTAYRKPFDNVGKRVITRSPIFKRVPMGEKGVGRFAVHKLGNKIKLISRPSELILDNNGNILENKLLDYEVEIEIDWNIFTQSNYLSEINIEYKKNTDKAKFYFQNSSGTYIKISDLKETWNRGMARQLKRHTLAMTSPKSDPQKFLIDLNFYNNWLDKFPEIDELLLQAPYKLTAILDKDYNLQFDYTFKLANNPTIGLREIKAGNGVNIIGALRPFLRIYYEEKGFEANKIEEILNEKIGTSLPFGGLMIELYSYDLDSLSLKDITYTPDVLKKTLKDQHGIRVFKDDLRVYDYGEPNNDWLGLDIKRVNNKEWFSNNQNIGFVYLDSANSGALIEKTNREGFLNNESFDFFKIVIEYILLQFRIERQKDRQKWILFNKKEKNNSFKDRISNFMSLVNTIEIDEEEKQKLLNEATQIESDYEKAQETLLIPAGVGMTASVALHEIEKLVPRMEETVEVAHIDPEKIRNQVEELDEYVSGILSVLKQAGTQQINIREVIDKAVSNYKFKLKIRKIEIEKDIPDDIGIFNCDKRYAVTMLMNLIDNSIYWLDTINKNNKSIFIKAYKEMKATHIIIADNGPGFKDAVHEIVTPFFSRKEGGIGIGMYLVDTIMMKYGKLNIYTDNNDIEIPNTYNGAIVELIFNKN